VAKWIIRLGLAGMVFGDIADLSIFRVAQRELGFK
jgi:hypothetical protein